jgi:heterogeneous nuclear ribonucleoprotein R
MVLILCVAVMAEGNGDPKMEHESSRVKEEVMDQTSEPHSADYGKLIEYGLDEKVASKLDEIYKTGWYM